MTIPHEYNNSWDMENLDAIVLASFAVTAIICANIWLNKKK